MAEEDKASKTEDPTQKRLADAREEGNVANSREVSHFTMLLGAVIFVATMMPWAADRIAAHLAQFLAQAARLRLEPEAMSLGLVNIVTTLAPYLTLPLLLFILMGLVGQLSQVGLLFTTKPLQPKMEKISPISGLKRMFSIKQVLEAVKGIFKIALVAVIAGIVLLPVIEAPHHLVDQDILVTLDEFHTALVILLVGVVLVMVIITLLDVIYTRHKYQEDLKMTKQEVKDEHKNMEGDPLVKRRIQQLRVDRSRQRMMQAVPEADVVITNPTHVAVALSYKMETMSAPRLVAKGQDHLAKRIRALAEEHEVPIVENPPLARALHASVDLDQEIPPEHYQAVAEVIGYVMRLKKTLH
ncbi:flagellar biosynthesis protein FlhB [Roseospira visakhapatnamensis]|uniref:Flagellar biosynthetic protein FlhB n=1 Tax=Roseospira visakhapatnamensis TaxID=390880 RepID=A0A7W6REC6_9PROT|nr:flagellar biosynthesis protein FlhB [Roseospira visakhapatnamensis]MBB4266790.1 flagellar biosynthetic protein FlhB [Roseospira visakhapatnamensis]